MTPIKYLQDSDQISKGHPSNISRTPIKNHQENHEKSPGHRSNIYRTHIKYLRDIDKNLQVTDLKYKGHPLNIS